MDGNTLISRDVRLSVTKAAIGNMQLDHMVAVKLNDPSVFLYEDDDRDIYVNGLGNMMPLPKLENIEKSNIPLEKSFVYYEKAGLDGHFLIKKAKKSVEEVVNKTKKPGDFFTERKTNLINYFKQII